MVIHNIRLPKQSTVGDVINELKTKVVQDTWNLVCSIIACICVSHIKGFSLTDSVPYDCLLKALHVCIRWSFHIQMQN